MFHTGSLTTAESWKEDRSRAGGPTDHRLHPTSLKKGWLARPQRHLPLRLHPLTFHTHPAMVVKCGRSSQWQGTAWTRSSELPRGSHPLQALLAPGPSRETVGLSQGPLAMPGALLGLHPGNTQAFKKDSLENELKVAGGKGRLGTLGRSWTGCYV